MSRPLGGASELPDADYSLLRRAGAAAHEEFDALDFRDQSALEVSNLAKLECCLGQPRRAVPDVPAHVVKASKAFSHAGEDTGIMDVPPGQRDEHRRLREGTGFLGGTGSGQGVPQSLGRHPAVTIVYRQLRGRCRGVRVIEMACHAAVRPCPARRPHLVIDGMTDQLVADGKPVRAPRDKPELLQPVMAVTHKSRDRSVSFANVATPNGRPRTLRSWSMHSASSSSSPSGRKDIRDGLRDRYEVVGIQVRQARSRHSQFGELQEEERVPVAQLNDPFRCPFAMRPSATVSSNSAAASRVSSSRGNSMASH